MQSIFKPILNHQIRHSSSCQVISLHHLIYTQPISILYSCKNHSKYAQEFNHIKFNNYSQVKLRLYVTMGTKNKNDQALMNELHRLSHLQENSQPNLGPFLMPRGKMDEKPLSMEESHPWSSVNWPERIKRIFRMARNLIIISFGGCLGLLVIYSITSELFAPSSTTNLRNMTIKTLEESEKLNMILKSPFKFHTSKIPSQSTQNQTGTIELRFWIETYKPNHAIKGDWTTIEWWKNWITPLITSQIIYKSNSDSNHNQSLDSKPNELKNKHDSHRPPTWWPGFLRSVMPNTFGNNNSSNDQRSWSDRFLSKQGSFEHGEVVAELTKESNGQWKYKTLAVDFPDSLNLKYRLNVLDELRKKKYSNQQEKPNREIDSQQNQTRYRFWNRRINL